MSEQHGFKRINFFKGFLTTEKDWNDAESYHIEKRQLQARYLHAPGVVAGFGGELRVIARARGDMAVEVQSGYAIDGQGRDLYLPEPVIKAINPDDFKLPQTVYLVLRYYEELTDFIAYKENLDYKGHRRVLESCKVELSQTEPDVSREIELARITLEKGMTRIKDAREVNDVRAGDLDLRFVPRAGVSGSWLPPTAKHKLEATLRFLRKYATEYARRGVQGARDASAAASAALVALLADQIDVRNAFGLFDLLLEAQGELVFDVDANHGAIAQQREFAEYRRALELLRGGLGEGQRDPAGLQAILAYQGRASDAAWAALGEKPMAPPAPREDDKPKAVTLEDWEGVKVMPALKESLSIGGMTWVMVDQIDILAKDSEARHNFSIKEAKDNYRSRQRLKYPDGTVVEDTGRAHVGGFAEYKLLNLQPGRPVVILRRMDYVYGDYELDFQVNGKSIAVSRCTGTDRVNRWRNWPVLIPAEAVTETSLQLRQLSLTAGRDVNMFQLWVYQPK